MLEYTYTPPEPMPCSNTTMGDAPDVPDDIDEDELYARVERAIADEIMGETSEYKEVIAEMWSLEELPLHLRSRYYHSVTYADAMRRSAWKGNTEAITTLGQLLETAIRDWLNKELTAKIRKEMEGEL